MTNTKIRSGPVCGYNHTTHTITLTPIHSAYDRARWIAVAMTKARWPWLGGFWLELAVVWRIKKTCSGLFWFQNRRQAWSKVWGFKA